MKERFLFFSFLWHEYFSRVPIKEIPIPSIKYRILELEDFRPCARERAFTKLILMLHVQSLLPKK